MPDVKWWVVAGIAVLALLLGLLGASADAASFADDLSWQALTQKLNSSGDIAEDVGLPGGGYILHNGTHLVMGVS